MLQRECLADLLVFCEAMCWVIQVSNFRVKESIHSLKISRLHIEGGDGTSMMLNERFVLCVMVILCYGPIYYISFGVCFIAATK